MKIDGGREKNRQLREREGLSNAPPSVVMAPAKKKKPLSFSASTTSKPVMMMLPLQLAQ